MKPRARAHHFFGPASAGLAGACLFVAAMAQAGPALWERTFFASTAVFPEARRPAATEVVEVSLLGGRVTALAPGLRAEEMPALAAALSSRLDPIFSAEPGSTPLLPAFPLRIAFFWSPGEPFSRILSFEPRDGSMIAGTIELNASGRSVGEAAEEAARGAALLALHARAPQASMTLLEAAARALALPEELTASDREEIREIGASADNSLGARGTEVFGALWIREMIRAGGREFLPVALRGIPPGAGAFESLAAAYQEETGQSAAEAFRRSLRRAYAAVDVLPDFANLSPAGLQAGGLDASHPGFLSWRLYSVSTSETGGLRVQWPEDGSRGFAVVHYEDSLPDDLVDFAPGDVKSIPLSGVSRVDWLVWGDEAERSALAAPVTVARDEGFPLSGLEARAESVRDDGVRLGWSTSSHRDLAGWTVLRREVDASGEVVMSPPEWLPARREDPEGSSYFYIDSNAVPGRFYRYDVWAVTEDGILSRAFRATLQAR